MAVRKILEVQDIDNWRIYSGNPNGNVYGQPGWLCQDGANGLVYVCTAAGANNWTVLPSTSAAVSALVPIPNGNTLFVGYRRELVIPGAAVNALVGYLYTPVFSSSAAVTFTDPADPTSGSGNFYAVLSTRSSVVIGGVTYPPQPTPIIRGYDPGAEIWRTFAAQVAPPATAASTGIAGQIAYDGGFIYICIAANSWVRAVAAAW